jgi:hypothetical protein
MSKHVLLLAVLLAAGCAQEQVPGQPAQNAAEEAATAGEAQQAEAPCPDPGYSPIPQGIPIEGDFYVRADRVYETRKGDERRKTTLELMSGDPSRTAETALSALVAQGFRQIDVPARDDGVARYAVRKAGIGRINVSATSDRGKKPSHPRSVGLISFDWPLPAAGGEVRTAPSSTDQSEESAAEGG